MQAIILAGGMGTRLRPLTYTVPKPMLPVAGQPALAHILEALAQADCEEVIVTTNYLADVVAAGLRDIECKAVVRCIREKDPLGTAGCIKKFISQLDDEFLVIQGDAVADVDYGRFIDFHHQNEADVSMTVMRVQDTREYGIVGVDNENRILRFQEKPRPEEAFSRLANAGFYLVKRHVFDNVPVDEPFDFSRQLFPALLADGARFYAWELQGYWVDIGRIQCYLEGNLHLIRGRGDLAPGVTVPDSTTLVPPFQIGAGTVIEPDCMIGPGVIIGAGCRVGHHTHIAGSVIYDDVVIGNNCRLNDCVVASWSQLEDNVTVDPMAIIAEGCDIGRNAQICAHSRIGPKTPVAEGMIIEGVVSPRLEKLEGLQRTMAHAPAFKDLPHEHLIVCTLLAVYSEMTARVIAETAGMPFSRVHAVLGQLESQGIILATADVPKRYALTRD